MPLSATECLACRYAAFLRMLLVAITEPQTPSPPPLAVMSHACDRVASQRAITGTPAATAEATAAIVTKLHTAVGQVTKLHTAAIVTKLRLRSVGAVQPLHQAGMLSERIATNHPGVSWERLRVIAATAQAEAEEAVRMEALAARQAAATAQASATAQAKLEADEAAGAAATAEKRARARMLSLGRGFFTDGPPPEIVHAWALKAVQPSRDHFTTPRAPIAAYSSAAPAAVPSAAPPGPGGSAEVSASPRGMVMLRPPMVVEALRPSLHVGAFRPSSARTGRIVPPSAVAMQLAQMRQSFQHVQSFYREAPIRSSPRASHGASVGSGSPRGAHTACRC